MAERDFGTQSLRKIRKTIKVETMTDADDKAKMAAIVRDLETLREETRALVASMTRVAEKMEAIVAQFERIPGALPDEDQSGHA